MEIEKKENGRTGKLIMKDDSAEIGEVAFLINDDENYVIDHTSVDESMTGKGIGKKLIDAIVNLARENNKKIIPVCEYAKKVFERNADMYADIWDKRQQ